MWMLWIFPEPDVDNGGQMILDLARTIASRLALKSNSGVTAIEYGLIAALISVAIVVAVTSIGTSLNLTFNMLASHLGSSPH